jgi:hypothetical protein
MYSDSNKPISDNKNNNNNNGITYSKIYNNGNKFGKKL